MSDNVDIALRRRPRTFPQELVDWVIDFLHDDKKTLQPCSLVCRQWLPASSYHLFSCLRWPPCRRHWPGVWGHDRRRSVCWCGHLLGGSETLDGVKSLLEGSPRIRENVQELCITMMWHGPHVIRRSTSPQEVMAILDLLPHIQDLELEHLQFLSEAVPAVIPTPPRSLRSFRLTFFCPTVVLQDIYNLLSCFRSISTVSFYETNLLHEPSVGLLHPPDELIKVKALELTFLNTGSASIWIDKVCTHLDFTSLTTLSVQAPLNVPHITDMTPALHRLLRRCTALQTLVCLRDVFHGLQTYQHACPSLHTLRFVKRLVADMPHLDSPWAKIQDIMGSPLAAAVCNVTFEVEFVISINHNEPNPDVSGLEQRFRRTLEALDWTPVVAIVERLRSMTISMEMKLRRSVEEVHDGGRSITCYSIPLSWDGDGRAYRTILESIVKERVPLSSHQRFDAHIVLSNPL